MEDHVDVRQTMLDSIKHFASLYASGVMSAEKVDIDALCDLAVRRATSRLNGTDRIESVEVFVDDLLRRALARTIEENKKLQYKLSDMVNSQLDAVLSDASNINSAVRKKVEKVLAQSSEDEQILKKAQSAKAIDVRCYRMHEAGHTVKKIAERLGVDVPRVELGIKRSVQIINALDNALDLYRFGK